MPTATAKTHPLVARHAELVAKYDRTAGAPKAQVSRQIIETELDLTLEGVAFEAWTKPNSFRQSFTMSETELVEQIGKLRALVASSDVSEVIRAAADRRLRKFEQQAERRGIEVGS